MSQTPRSQNLFLALSLKKIVGSNIFFELFYGDERGETVKPEICRDLLPRVLEVRLGEAGKDSF